MAKPAKTALYHNPISGGQFAIEDQSLTTGARFYVDSGANLAADDVGFGMSPVAPFATLDYAISSPLVTADSGDIIYVMPGHAETLSAAADITMDVDGIKIQGLGWGASIPTFTITTGSVAAPISWTADNCILDGIRIVGGNAGGSDVTITISGSYNQFSNSILKSGSDTELGIGAGLGVITLLDTSTAITEVIFDNIKYIGGAGHDEAFITPGNGANGATSCWIKNCNIIGTFADDTIQLDNGTNTQTLWHIEDSTLGNLGGNNIVISMDSGGVNFLQNIMMYGGNSTQQPIVEYTASFLNNVMSCEAGSYGANTLTGSVTNWAG